MKNIIVLIVALLSASSSFAKSRFNVNLEKDNAVAIKSEGECRSFLTRLSWIAESSENNAEIVEVMSTVRLFKDNIAADVCPMQEFNSNYLILKMDELIGYDSHPGIVLKTFSEIRTTIQSGVSL